MFFKRIILFTIADISAILFLTYFFTSFKISDSEAGYFVGLAILLAFINYFIDPVIKFFTLKIKFLTVWLFNFLVSMPLLYILSLILPGFTIHSGDFRSFNIGVFQINSFTVNEISTVIIASLVLGFAAAFVRWLME